ncbi:MAG: hypothetical protein PVI44_11615, partial [Balneolaceae bacterium]
GDSGDEAGNDSTAAATDYNSSRSNTTSSIMGDSGDEAGNDSTAAATDYNSSRSNTTSSIMGGSGDGVPDDTTAAATDYNSSRSNTTSSGTRAADDKSNTGPIRWMAPESLITSGPVGAGSGGENPVYQEKEKGENVLFEGQANPGSGNGTAAGTLMYQLEPGTSHNASRSNRSSGITTDDFGGDPDGDGYPDFMKRASLSISKRDTRKSKANAISEQDEAGFRFILQINDGNTDNDDLKDAAARSTFSISPASSTLQKEEMPNRKSDSITDSSGDNISGQNNLQMWTYELGTLSNTETQDDSGFSDLLDGASLVLFHKDQSWHYALRINTDYNREDVASLLEHCSFGIINRSARTGRKER